MILVQNPINTITLNEFPEQVRAWSLASNSVSGYENAINQQHLLRAAPIMQLDLSSSAGISVS
jgi:hypothetical protein